MADTGREWCWWRPPCCFHSSLNQTQSVNKMNHVFLYLEQAEVWRAGPFAASNFSLNEDFPLITCSETNKCPNIFQTKDVMNKKNTIYLTQQILQMSNYFNVNYWMAPDRCRLAGCQQSWQLMGAEQGQTEVRMRVCQNVKMLMANLHWFHYVSKQSLLTRCSLNPKQLPLKKKSSGWG